jgi:hypothetical protein
MTMYSAILNQIAVYSAKLADSATKKTLAQVVTRSTPLTSLSLHATMTPLADAPVLP